MTAPSPVPIRPRADAVPAADQIQLTTLLRHARDVRLDQLEALAVRGSAVGLAVLEAIDSRVAAEVVQELSEIEAALLRLSLGTYGACERCTSPISLERLYARPHARVCGPCSAGRR